MSFNMQRPCPGVHKLESDKRYKKQITAATPAALSHHRAAPAMWGPAVEEQNSCREVASVQCPAGPLPQNSSSPKANMVFKSFGGLGGGEWRSIKQSALMAQMHFIFGRTGKCGCFCYCNSGEPKPLSPAVFQPSRFCFERKIWN